MKPVHLKHLILVYKKSVFEAETHTSCQGDRTLSDCNNHGNHMEIVIAIPGSHFSHVCSQCVCFELTENNLFTLRRIACFPIPVVSAGLFLSTSVSQSLTPSASILPSHISAALAYSLTRWHKGLRWIFNETCDAQKDQNPPQKCVCDSPRFYSVHSAVYFRHVVCLQSIIRSARVFDVFVTPESSLADHILIRALAGCAYTWHDLWWRDTYSKMCQ